GRFLYLWDLDRAQGEGAVWSLAPAPCWPAYDRFACRHGLGYTVFETELGGLLASWTLSVDETETVELWRVRLEDLSGRPRRLALVAYLEWNCGVSPAPRREFQKLFLENGLELHAEEGAETARAVITAGCHMWDVPGGLRGHWNRSFPYWSAFAAAQGVSAAEGDKAAFLGRGESWRRPAALRPGARWAGSFGRHGDPVAALRSDLEIPAGGAFDGGFALATAAGREEAAAIARRFAAPGPMDASLAGAREGWRRRLAEHRVELPSPTLEPLVNDWLRYQAISARLWGRAGYYQQSGAFGFRDQLQDSQLWLTIEPERCREQIRLHAGHQFADGSVHHWWHPLTEQGHVTRMSDDLLWLAFVTASYLKETGDLRILDDPAPYLDDPGARPLLDHVERGFARAFRRTSPRGLPYIGGGDWNDGLSALGLEERGESVWLAQFLAGLCADWSEVYRRLGNEDHARELAGRRTALIAALEEHAWDGAWYRRATRDDGSWIGSSGNRFGRIFLNPQTWAILTDAAPPERAARCLAAVEEHLVTDAGALLLAPAWEEPDETVGYITRYAPGLRENGGVYTHAAVWAIAAAAKLGNAPLVGRLLAAIDPTTKDPERYWAEPYVLPGNVDGPASPHHGRAGWSWYTGSAAWLPRVVSEWVLGVRPTWDGLLLDPCLPPGWDRARMRRPWRGARLEVTIERDPGSTPGGAPGEVAVELDGRPLEGNLLPPLPSGARARARVRFG
ncbi:MAG TPA: glycosyl hydrolase family 65 protein, partial [Thermoanaerobaculia bacterium]|nr:glycosyl hydrolase family 65 protein [Thermoanaerobaculia bacterium]